VNGSPKSSDWAQLFREACNLIRQVNSKQPIIEYWTFGGGTAMMLQVDHRESHDVDIFFPDPQLLGFLDPKKHDFVFEVHPSDYGGDGASFLKLVFDAGEIDFIVDGAKTDNPTTEREIEGQLTLLETIPEIITKKIVRRGSSIQPRDIFDIAAGAEQYSDRIISALRKYPEQVAGTIKALDRLNPEFVRDAISGLLIREGFLGISKTSLDRTKELLRKV
jgi:Nucleotidyl transferase AbiEii toxin, Type IV TA system